MALALPVAFRTLLTCLFIFVFGSCAENKFFFFFCMASKLKSKIDMQMDVLPAGCEDSRPSKCTAQIHESQAKAEHLTLKAKLEAKCSVLKHRSRREEEEEDFA